MEVHGYNEVCEIIGLKQHLSFFNRKKSNGIGQPAYERQNRLF